jgi:hypothetical protein
MSDVDTAADTVAESMPLVSERAIQAEHAKDAERAAEFADLKDAEGRAFDPALHVVGKDGQPTLIRTGRNRGKLRRKSGAKQPTPTVSTTVPGPGAEVKDYHGTARVTVESFTTLARLLLGEEWALVKDPTYDEKAALTDAWEGYFKARGISDIPPELLLSVTMVGYVGPRLTLPATKGRLARAREWVRVKVFRRARTDSGNDRKRKDHSSAADESAAPRQGVYPPGTRPAVQ